MKIISFLIFFLIIIGTFLRLTNTSTFKFYPDAYQSLIVANNINNYQSVVGNLGKEGMVFPGFFSWTRPSFPLLINSLHIFIPDQVTAAKIGSLMAGILAIPLSYFFIKTIFRSRLTGICAALLLTFSFNHTVWSGFIMTETTGILLIISFLYIIFSNLNSSVKIANFKDLFGGIVFGLAVLARYEYTILFIPIIYIFIADSPTPKQKLITFFSGFIFAFSLIVSILFPIKDSFSIIIIQLKDISIQFAKFVLPLIGLLFFGKAFIKYLSLILLAAIPIITIFYPALRDFLINDFMLYLTFLIGAITMTLKPEYRKRGLFVFLCIFLLGFVYHRVNPDMQRYIANLIPFILIPASLGLSEIINVILKRRLNLKTAILPITLATILLMQATKAYQGMKYWRNGEWYRVSYEEKSANIVKNNIPNKNYILIASFPEPYYYFSNISTYSIADTYPYVFIDNSLDNRMVLIIEDMGMRDVFPNFTKFLDEKMKAKRTREFWTHEVYHFGNKSEKENYPVILYELPLAELKKNISGQ